MGTLENNLTFVPKEGDSPEKTITALFAYKNRLLRAAEYSMTREIIFFSRARIAETFRTHGGEKHEETAKFFESLESPDALIPLVLAPTKSTLERERQRGERHRGGFFVLEAELNGEGLQAVQRHFPRGIGTGKQMRMSLQDLLYASKRDERPVYVMGPITERVFKALHFITLMRPELVERIEIMEKNEDGFKFTRYNDAVTEMKDAFPLVAAKTEGQVAQIDGLREFLFKTPEAGEIYTGVVTKVVDFGVFIGLKPDKDRMFNMIEGLVHMSELDPENVEGSKIVGLQEGDRINVEILAIDLHSGHIRLSVKKARESLEQGKKPAFDIETAMKALPNLG